MRIGAFCLVVSTFGILLAHGANVKIQINHWNDISAQLERFKPLQSSTDVPKECSVGGCHGGFAYLINEINKNDSSIKSENVLRLTSGNLVGGETGWLSLAGWEKFGSLVHDHYKPTVMSLGIKEFGAGLSQTCEYLYNTNKPIAPTVLSNVKNCNAFTVNTTAEYKFCKFITDHYVINVKSENGEGVDIGVVGYVNPTVVKLGSPGSLEFNEVVPGLKDSIQILRAKQIKFIIALGDGSLETAKSIIDEYPDVKIVLFGRGFGSSKTTVYPERHKGSYIGTAGKYGASMGKMIVQFDSTSGDITSTDNSKLVPIDGNDYDHPANNRVNDFFHDYVFPKETDILGRSHVTIHGGDVCWTKECNLGNIMADAAVHCAYIKSDEMEFDIPEGPLLGIWHGGALFYDVVEKKSNISALDVHKWLPFHNNVHIVAIKGSSLKLLFKASATGLDDNTKREPKYGQFLQISNGMEVTYSTSGGQGNLEKIRVIKETDSTIPKLTEIGDEERFLLALPSFIREGRSIFGFVKNSGFFLSIPATKNGYLSVGFDDDCLANYIRSSKGLITGFEERIFIDVSDSPGSSKCKNNTTKHVLLTLFITLLILGGVFVGWKFLWPRLNSRYSRYP